MFVHYTFIIIYILYTDTLIKTNLNNKWHLYSAKFKSMFTDAYNLTLKTQLKHTEEYEARHMDRWQHCVYHNSIKSKRRVASALSTAPSLSRS